ncbi:MAG TPA: phosphopantothenoylcysteine decarboxylase [Tepidisphaeraceae bacterium]|nr:phosphopantothenoylcysteine decarboxylase [Tepidisphaeraceae bacterium]
MRLLITAGPTREPIDPVRFIGNRSSGQMGAALATAGLAQGHEVTVVLGPVHVPMPPSIRRLDIETAAEMHAAVLAEFPRHDVLIMAAAVADYRPKAISPTKLGRGEALTIELEPTADIVAAASGVKRHDQRTIAFSLEHAGEAGITRAREKMRRKRVDLMVFNPTDTMDAATIEPVLLYPDGRSDKLCSRTKREFADNLVKAVAELFR